jgi:hypothetical protein
MHMQSKQSIIIGDEVNHMKYVGVHVRTYTPYI